jgi:dTDP-4-amino-4,6-dideoxygalactose transaminase
MSQNKQTLAINGGPATWTEDLSPWPIYEEDEIAAVETVLRSGNVNQWTGEDVTGFGAEFAEYVGAKHGIPVANGTVSLELALLGAGIGAGDDVIVTPRTFMASASCVVTSGATPIFADIERDWGNMTAETIEAALTPDTRAIILVHLGGMPAELNPIVELAEEHDLLLIEDCAQAHGARYRDRMVGSIGDCGSFSFCQDKIMSTGGEGGMFVTDSDAYFRAVWEMKDHGKSYEAVFEREHPPGFRWLHESFGTNLRMTSMQAAIGRRQLKKLDDWVAKRTKHAQILTDRLGGVDGLRVPVAPDHVRHAWYKFYCYVRPDALKADWSRDRIIEALQAEGVPGLSGSCSEVYLEKAYQDAGLGPNEPLPVARELGETSLMFPVHPTLREEEVHAMADALEKVMRVAVR